MKRLIAISLLLLATATGCENLDKVRDRVNVLEAKNDELEEKFRLYVESDARSTALAEQALVNLQKALESIRRYVEKTR